MQAISKFLELKNPRDQHKPGKNISAHFYELSSGLRQQHGF